MAVREYPPLEDEIDLRQYIRTLLHYWRWIVGLALLAAVLAFAISSVLPPQYEATALVAVTGPRYLMQFDPRMRDVPFDPKQFTKGYATIAMGDELLMALLEAHGNDLSRGSVKLSLEGLKEMLNAQAVGDGNLVQLTVRTDNPEGAARLANAWAERYVAQLKVLYGQRKELSALEEQVAQAKVAVEHIDAELAQLRREYGIGFRFSATSGAAGFSGIVPRPSSTAYQPAMLDVVEPLGIVYQLQARTQLLADYENRASRIAQLLEEARMVMQHADGAAPAVVSGLIADMLGLGQLNTVGMPQVQIDLGDLDVAASLAAFVEALEAKQAATQEAIAQLRDEVASLQAEVATHQMRLEQLLREQEVNQNAYLTLANKLEETRIEVNGDIARIASRAVAPEKPAAPRRVLNTALAAVAAVIVAAFGALFAEYWRQGALRPEMAPGEATV
ncbi:MAG: Wzz/FepE/Etk N-terminal domain-containing protein [Anaerolineae bacterium]|nr:Wzz/FepE/Etk N-terminal domain-containing protein [Anaerolineae bacterium]